MAVLLAPAQKKLRRRQTFGFWCGVRLGDQPPGAALDPAGGPKSKRSAKTQQELIGAGFNLEGHGDSSDSSGYG
jgi:hypothetical protein